MSDTAIRCQNQKTFFVRNCMFVTVSFIGLEFVIGKMLSLYWFKSFGKVEMLPVKNIHLVVI